MTILNLFIVVGVGFEDVSKNLWVDARHIVRTSRYIKKENFLNTLDRHWISIHLLPQVVIVDDCRVDVQNVAPDLDSLRGEVTGVRIE